MSGARKETVKGLMDYANKLTLMEGGKSSARVHDVRQLLALMVKLDATATKKGHKSALLVLRRLAVKQARKK
jgi:hypothetical protein